MLNQASHEDESDKIAHVSRKRRTWYSEYKSKCALIDSIHAHAEINHPTRTGFTASDMAAGLLT